MLHQHKCCVYNGKRKLELPITCENFVLFVLKSVFILLCKYIFLENVEKKFTVGGFREVPKCFFCSNYKTHTNTCYFIKELKVEFARSMKGMNRIADALCPAIQKCAHRLFHSYPS